MRRIDAVHWDYMRPYGPAESGEDTRLVAAWAWPSSRSFGPVCLFRPAWFDLWVNELKRAEEEPMKRLRLSEAGRHARRESLEDQIALLD